MIAVIDYDAGNISSVMNALKTLGFDAVLTGEPSKVRDAVFAVLPGVGSFGAAMRSLEKKNLRQAIARRLENDLPTLGICLGMQLLFKSSEESDGEGFGFFDGEVKKLDSVGLPLPHIGWTTVNGCDGVFAPFENEYFYFVHGYAAVSADGADGCAFADYGSKFLAAVTRGNISATQFHPEKSGEAGLKLLKTLIGGGKA